MPCEEVERSKKKGGVVCTTLDQGKMMDPRDDKEECGLDRRPHLKAIAARSNPDGFRQSFTIRTVGSSGVVSAISYVGWHNGNHRIHVGWGTERKEN